MKSTPIKPQRKRCASHGAQPQESIADFKHRIALLMRNREGGKIYSIIGAARPHPCVVRKRDPQWSELSQQEKDAITGKKPLTNPKPHGILSND